jgi:pimeloyl-ACP methyl ester carboxylesterase
MMEYPQQVVGIVFVDGSYPQQERIFPQAMQDLQKKYVLYLFPLVKVATEVGVLRALGQCTEVTPGMEAYAAWIKADSCDPQQISSSIAEMNAVPASGDEAVNAGPFGNMPILIFSQDTSQPMKGLPADIGQQASVTWNRLQENTKKLSSNSRRIIAKGSGHYVMVERSELVNREVASFIEQVRTGAVSPQNGTTTTQ